MVKKKATKSTAVVKNEAPKGASALIAGQEIPDFMKGHERKGTELVSIDDVATPRITLLQALSKEVVEYDHLRPGNFFHVQEEYVFTKPFIITPIFLDVRYILWNPRNSGGGILARADDGVHWNPADVEFTVKLDKKDGGDTVTWKTAKTVQQSGLDQWGTMNPKDPQSPPAATKMFNFIVAFPEHPELGAAVLTCQRSSITVGRHWNAKLKSGSSPIYGRQYLVSSVDDRNKRGEEFKNLKITSAGFLQDQHLFQEYATAYEAFKGRGFDIKDIEGLGDEEVGDAASNAKGEAVPEEGKPDY